MKKLSLEQWKGIARHGITTIGTVLVAFGKLSVTDLETISGSVMLLVGVIWSVKSKSTPIEAPKEETI